MTETKHRRLTAEVQALTQANIKLTNLLIALVKQSGGEVHIAEKEAFPPKGSRVDITPDLVKREIIIKYIPPALVLVP